MSRKHPAAPIRPAGIQAMSPGLYAQVKAAVRALAIEPLPIRAAA